MMTNTLKKLVSKNKRRYKENGYNLDLSYVTDRVIAMGFPSVSLESVYRNSLEEVRRFLEDKHKNNYKIYNLCSERSYDIKKFHSRVAVYPFDDHSPPEFGHILPFCCDVAQWLSEDEEHVAVVHCKAGKGRTGLMICSFLLYSGMFSTAEDVLSYYGSARTFDSNGVTIPSQRRYVDYFATKLAKRLEFEYSPVKMFLTYIIIEPPPHVGFGHHEAHIQFEVLQPLVPPFLSEVYTVNLTEAKIILELRTPLLLSGDVKISFRQKLNVNLFHGSTKPKFVSHVPHGKLFHFWVNTFFVNLQHSTPLSHELYKTRDSQGKVTSFSSSLGLPLKPWPQRNSVVRQYFPQSSHNHGSDLFSYSHFKTRAASMSLPSLPTQILGNTSETVMNLSSTGSSTANVESSFLPMEGLARRPFGSEIIVKLSKDQIDKASNDNSGRFDKLFSVTLVLFKPKRLTATSTSENCRPSPQFREVLQQQEVKCGGKD